jgi:hypothetical protein
MNLVRHFLITFVMTVIFFVLTQNFSPVNFWIIMISSLAIDIDHLFYDLPEKRNSVINILKYWWRMADEYKGRFYLFHTIDTLVIVFLLYAYVDKIFFYIFLGFFFHIMQDSITNTRATKSLKWLKNYSIFTYVIGKKGE